MAGRINDLGQAQSVEASVEGNKTNLKGEGVLVSGTGKFAVVKGDVQMVGARFTGAPIAPGAELYLDVVVNIKN